MDWGTALGGLASGFFGYKGTQDQNIASAHQAQKQMDFQERMSNTQIQRRMADLKKGGLNPILAGKHEASSPSGAQAPQFNKAQVALQNASTAANIDLITKQATKLYHEGVTAEGEALHWKYILGLEDAVTNMSNPFSSAKENYIANKANAQRNIKMGGPQGKQHLRATFREMPLPGSHHPVTKSRKAQAERNFRANYQTTIRNKGR